MPPASPSHRRSRLRIGCLLAFLVVFLALAVALVWLYGGEGTPQASRLQTETPAPQMQVYVVKAEESWLRVQLHSALGTLHGQYDIGGGTVALEPVAGGWQMVGNLTFDARSMKIGNPFADQAMRRALEVNTYPYGVFVARSETPLPDLSAPQTVDLAGQLELHGVVRDYVIPTAFHLEGETITLTTQIMIDAGDFGISIPRLIGTDEFNADLGVVAYRSEGTPALAEQP
jgi:polyisoprenoid-binding protein YceI